ncbi:GAF and ANTAR domain-containing protein [Agrococcus sp. ProA11]|uniref:GAF and ANTAR domain-containing protein n=1 Tax=Agrococcus chionoecetis TaxID=3153752 RepID=UPI00326127F7
MRQMSREARLSESFAMIAHTLATDYDVVQLLHDVMGECIGLLDVQASGLLLKNAHGELELVASTSEAAAFVEIMQLNADAGPCVESLRTGETITLADVTQAPPAWEQFQAAALQHGFCAAHAVPLRAQADTIGAIGLFREQTGELSRADAAAAGALASLAALGILQERTMRSSSVVAAQLQRALDSRVIIEQAKGVLAASADVDIEEAFRILRRHARSSNRKLHEIAREVVARTLRLTASAAGAARSAAAPSVDGGAPQGDTGT